MSLLANVLGFSLVGLGVRFGQLGIQRKNLFTNPGGHLLSMGAFGFLGYWAYQWEVRSEELLTQKRTEMIERRKRLMAQAEASGSIAVLGNKPLQQPSSSAV